MARVKTFKLKVLIGSLYAIALNSLYHELHLIFQLDGMSKEFNMM